jgi:hypothetical protein
VKCLTSEDFKQRMVVILAGYEGDIDDMLQVNAGLKSRFSEKIEFSPFSMDKCVAILAKQLANERFVLSEQAKESREEVLEPLICMEEFGNGRTLETLVKKIARLAATAESLRICDGLEIIENAMVVKAVADVISTLRPKLRSDLDAGSSKSSSAVSTPPPKLAQKFAHSFDSAKPPRTVTSTKAATAEDPKICEEPTEVAVGSSGETTDHPTEFLCALQTLLDQKGLTSNAKLAELDIRGELFKELCTSLSNQLNVPYDTVYDMMIKWQSDQKKVVEELKKQKQEIEQAKRMKRKAQIPIWRCGVCGRADLPYIVCYVSPRIVRYTEVDCDELA